MESKVQKWGNSLAVRIPKPFASEIGLGKDDEVELQLSEGKLVISPLRKPQYSLAGLLAGVKRSNIHREFVSDPPIGKEVW